MDSIQKEIEVRKDRLAHLQSETAKAQGGKIPKGSLAAQEQSKFDAEMDQRNLGEKAVGRLPDEPQVQEFKNEVKELQSAVAREHEGKVPTGSKAADWQSVLDKQGSRETGNPRERACDESSYFSCSDENLSDPLLNIKASRH